MLQRLRDRLTYANVMSTIAVVLAITGGTAYAMNEWTGANIVDGSLTTADVKKTAPCPPRTSNPTPSGAGASPTGR